MHFWFLTRCKIERFMSYKIARSYKIVILLRNANFMTILASKMLFVCEKLLDKKIFSSFSRKFGYLLSKKDLEIKSDPFRSNPWFFGSTIRSRSSRRKWICNPITILKKEDLDPKGSRSDHDRHISGSVFYKIVINRLR